MTRSELGENQRIYIDALRSNRFTQICGLHSEGTLNSRCAVGVALDIFCSKRIYLAVDDAQPLMLDCITFDSYTWELLKFKNDGLLKVIKMNDDSLYSFKKIADILEENPSDFFCEPA